MVKTFSSTPLYIIELITTIPSLFQMLAIMFGRFIAKNIDYKNNIPLGIVLFGTGGVFPIFIQEIILILLSRAVFGIGVGLISSSLFTLIISFFDGETRSTMIGMQGSIGGLGSLVATFIFGQLLICGWSYSFITYFVSFILCFMCSGICIFIQEKNHSVYVHFGENASSVVFVFQSLGAFLAPYLGNMFSYVTTGLNSQFIMRGVIFGVLALIAFFIKRPIQD